MSTEERVVALMGAIAGILLVVATPQLPRDAAIVSWVVLASAFLCYGAYKARGYYRRRRVSDAAVVIMASLLGALAGLIALYIFPTRDVTAVAGDLEGSQSGLRAEVVKIDRTSQSVSGHFAAVLTVRMSSQLEGADARHGERADD